jgi:hypothetical protein
MNEQLHDAYARLIRWYPREWRDLNGEALVGVLLDQADAEHRDTPAAGERLHLALAGLRIQLVRRERLSGAALATLLAVLLFSLFYVFVITWSPGGSGGSFVGPFANPTIVTAIALIAALFANLFGLGACARALCVLAAAVEFGAGILATFLNWPAGPGIVAWTIIVGVCLTSAVPRLNLRQAAFLAAGTFAAVAIVVAAEIAGGRVPEFLGIAIAASWATPLFIGAALAFYIRGRSHTRASSPLSR